MDSRDIRESFLRFFESKEHLRLKSASLIPRDPTLLFTAAGMVPLKAYFLQEEAPPSLRITTVQKCVRTNDIEQVGVTKRHHTFFEMLGNFSIGDYFKDEAIAWALEYVVKVLGIPFDRLWVSIFKDDDEAREIWRKVGIKEERIIPLGEEDNFWTMGPVGPCGPCSEIYFDRGAMTPEEESQVPGGDGERFLEVWNLVFTQFDRQPDGSLRPLPKKNIDTGMGLERITSVIEGVDSDFETDLFMPLIKKTEELSKAKYGEDVKKDRAFKAIADHIRAIVFLISDGVIPSNEKRGYVLRRLIRRSALFGRNLGMNEPFLFKIAPTVAESLGDVYPELVSGLPVVDKLLKEEELRFNTTIKSGFEFLTERMESLLKKGEKTFPAEDVFYLYDTLGFPAELSEMMIRENGFSFDREKFNFLLDEQREKARGFYKGGEAFAERVFFVEVKSLLKETVFEGYEKLETDSTVAGIVKEDSLLEAIEEGDEAYLVLDKTPFYPEKGGQVGDTGTIESKEFVFEVIDTQIPVEGLIVHKGKVIKGKVIKGAQAKALVNAARRHAIMRAHTSTHLLQAVLREVFGSTVSQQGSEVKPDEFRFDFNFQSSFDRSKLPEIESKMNDIVLMNVPVSKNEMSLDEAVKKGALAFFGEKYGSRVRVVEIPGVSIELCGGTHINNTGEIGIVVITGVRSVAAGVKRIEALTGRKAYEFLSGIRESLAKVAEELETQPENVESKVIDILEENASLKKALSEAKKSSLKEAVKGATQIATYNGNPVFGIEVDGIEFSEMKKVYDIFKNYFSEGGAIILSKKGEETLVLVGSISDSFTVEEFSTILKSRAGVKGGGSKRIFQGSSGKGLTLKELKKILEERVA